MQKVLIAHGSEELCNSLSIILSSRFQVTTCSDGDTAMSLLPQLKPDAMIVDLMLPKLDGLSVLERSLTYIPPTVLAITSHWSGYVRYSLATHRIGFIMMAPCDANAVAARLTDMIQYPSQYTRDSNDPEQTVKEHLLLMGFPPDKDGFIQLKGCIPLYAKDPSQRLSKEIYPVIAEKYGYNSGIQVERSVRVAIEKAWEVRIPAVWDFYFPPDANGVAECPTNKQFIARLAMILEN